MTRLRLTTPTGRAAVGYDPDLTTYYIETGPASCAEQPADDPDEGLAAVRGRIPHDLPHLPALLADLQRRGVTLTPDQRAALQRPPPYAAPHRDLEAAGSNRQNRRNGNPGNRGEMPGLWI